MKKKIYEIWMEFFHIKYENGGVKYSFSSKKFWFQIAQILLYTSVLMRMFGYDRITDAFLGILTTHAIAVGSWYAWKKHKDIEAQEKFSREDAA